MAAVIRTCSVDELRSRLEQEACLLVDVREYPEYAEGHIAGSRLISLGELRRDPSLVGDGGEVWLICRTGRRARTAAEVLRQAGRAEPVVVEGGMDAWRQAGNAVQREKGPIALERQVRIAAGGLILIGLLIPGLSFLPYIVGGGLILAGVTNTCAMGLLLARLPWNRRPVSSDARERACVR